MTPLVLGLAILGSGTFGTVQFSPVPVRPASAHVHHSAIAAAVMVAPPDASIKAAVENYFSDLPIMVDIASCESNFHQDDLSGGLLISATDDLGVMQINRDAHADEARALGYDLSTLEGNMEFARYLYDREGTAPWLSSARCWRTGASIADANI
ncbi:MAG: hypothetical protein ACREGH_00185 [Minisyncoccia bacterium]